MAQDWIGKFFENRGWLGLVQYSQTSGLTVANTPIALETYTYADFATIDTTYRRYIVISDLHSANTASGASGGSRWLVNPLASTPEEKIVLDSGPLWFDTYADYTSTITASDHPGLEVRIGNVGKGLPILVNKETSTPGTFRLVPDNGQSSIFHWVFGSIASPTNTVDTGVGSGEFHLGDPFIPGGLVQSGDGFQLRAAFARRGSSTAAVAYLVCLGTTNTSSDARLFQWNFSGVATNPAHVTADFHISVASATRMVTNAAVFNGEHANSTNRADITASVNFANAMYLTAFCTAKDSADAADLLSLELIWKAQV